MGWCVSTPDLRRGQAKSMRQLQRLEPTESSVHESRDGAQSSTVIQSPPVLTRSGSHRSPHVPSFLRLNGDPTGLPGDWVDQRVAVLAFHGDGQLRRLRLTVDLDQT